MLLSELQGLLSDIYQVDTRYDIYDFLVTDPQLARELEGRDGAREPAEKLLIAEAEDGLDLALYLDPTLLDRLNRHNPVQHLHRHNLADFWTVLEGVSHFTYLIWNANLDKGVTLLEMEMQAEVDKYIGAMLLFQQQIGEHPQDLHRRLFEQVRFDAALEGAELERYQDANHYAGKYCHSLDHKLRGKLSGWSSELRRFYRLPQGAKIRHIQNTA